MIRCVFMIGVLLIKPFKLPSPQEYWGITQNNQGYYAYVDFKNGSFIELFDAKGRSSTFEATCTLEVEK